MPGAIPVPPSAVMRAIALVWPDGGVHLGPVPASRGWDRGAVLAVVVWLCFRAMLRISKATGAIGASAIFETPALGP